MPARQPLEMPGRYGFHSTRPAPWKRVGVASSVDRQSKAGVNFRHTTRRRLRMTYDLGGQESLTEAQQQLVRRCAMISAQCELMEAEMVQGKPLNAIAYGTLTRHLTRTPNALCLKREPVDVTPVLNEYLSTLPAETQDLVAAADESEG